MRYEGKEKGRRKEGERKERGRREEEKEVR